MNFTKQNNPVVIGLLVVVLLGALVGVFQQIKHVQTAMAADNAVHQAATSAPAPTPTDARVIVDSFVRPAFAHDPFQAPAIKPAAPPVTPRPQVAMTPLPTMSTAPLTIRPLPTPISSPAPVSTPTAPAAPEVVDVKTLRVTAIMKGNRATAIVEREGHDPVAVAVGSRIAGYNVSSISNDGVILTDHNGIYTISLASAPSSQEGDQDTQAPPVTAKPAMRAEAAQETANVPH